MTVITDVMLMQLADGVLDPALEPAVRAAMAADPALKRQYDSYCATREPLAALFNPIARLPTPTHLIESILAAPARPTAADANRVSDWATPQRWPAAAASLAARVRERTAELFAPGLATMSASALAATLVIGVAAGWALRAPQAPLPPPQTAAQGPLAVVGTTVLAAGDLRRALDSDLSTGASPNTATRIAVSFRAEDGRLCRQYEMRGADGGAAGIACRAGADWRIEVQAALTPAGSAPGTFRPAGDSTPKALAAFIDDTIAGDYLTKAQENDEIAKDWRR